MAISGLFCYHGAPYLRREATVGTKVLLNLRSRLKKRRLIRTDKAIQTDKKDTFRRYPTVMVLSIILVSLANCNYQLWTMLKIQEAGNEQSNKSTGNY